jgi:enamine deaminase RidA (YjgF/YER057c/UK114 family)
MWAVVLFLFLLCRSHSYRLRRIPAAPRKFLAELRIQIQGTRNAHTTLRNNDVVLYKLDPPMEQCVRGIGVYQADKSIAPLYCHSEGSSLFSADFGNTMSAVALNEQRRLLRVVSSDRRGRDFIIEEFLDNDIYVPLLEDKTEANGAESNVSYGDSDVAETTALTFSPLASIPKAVVAGGLQFLSGILPVGGGEGKVPSDVKQQAELCFAQLAHTLGGDVRRLCKITFYLRDIDQSDIVLAAFKQFLGCWEVGIAPAVTLVGAHALLQHALIQIDAIALAPMITV